MKKKAIEIVKMLQAAGHTAYFAGGSVRDMLMKKKPKDFDIATSARPNQIEKIIKKTIPVGKQFGVIISVIAGHQFEIATFRRDSGQSDGRRPKAVFFTSDREDAFRRDFTINGIFYDPVRRQMIDYVHGQTDIRKKIISFIGDPGKRIQEDHLRILRAIRFKNELGFRYESKTWRAVVKKARLVKGVSPERIKQELDRMFTSPNRSSALKDLQRSGVLKYILPEVQKMVGVSQPFQWHGRHDVFEHTVRCFRELTSDASETLVWAMLLHDVGKPATFRRADRIRFTGHIQKSEALADKMLKRLHFSRREIETILWLIKYHMLLNDFPKMRLSRKRHWLLQPHFGDLLELYRADVKATVKGDVRYYSQIKKMWRKTKKTFPSIPKLISGQVVMKLCKIKEGPEVGTILAQVREAQLAGTVKTSRDARFFIKKLKLPTC